jgi:hypothetical protein
MNGGGRGLIRRRRARRRGYSEWSGDDGWGMAKEREYFLERMMGGRHESELMMMMMMMVVVVARGRKERREERREGGGEDVQEGMCRRGLEWTDDARLMDG